MANSFDPLFPGMLLDSTTRFAQNHASAQAAGEPIRDMGWACTLIPEELGGVGGGIADLASIIEGLATHGVQLPVVEACAIAPLLLQAARDDVARRWLDFVCDGSATVVPLIALSSPLEAITLQARQLDIGFELTGQVRGVDNSLEATHYVVAARIAGTGKLMLFVIDNQHMPAPTARFRTMEGRRTADFTLAPLILPTVACIAEGDAVAVALTHAGDAALMLTAVDTVASLAALIAHTVTYLQERRQFGAALSTFQVLRHRTADMYVRYLAARGLLIHAFSEYDRSAPDLSRTLQLMKVSLAESARACAEAAIQMHGGMGMSEEVLATRLAQRLLTSEFRYGDRLLHTAHLLRSAGATSLTKTGIPYERQIGSIGPHCCGDAGSSAGQRAGSQDAA